MLSLVFEVCCVAVVCDASFAWLGLLEFPQAESKALRRNIPERKAFCFILRPF